MRLIDLLILAFIFSIFLLFYSRLDYAETKPSTELRLLNYSCNIGSCEVDFEVVNPDAARKEFDFFIILTKNGKRYRADSGSIVLSPKELTILNRTFYLDLSNSFEPTDWKYEVHFHAKLLDMKIGVELYGRG